MSFVKEYAHKKAIIFTDFDGTVTLQDSNDYLTEELGFGKARRLELNDLILNGEITFRDAFSQMLDSVDMPFDKCIEFLLKHISLDPGFKETFHWAQEQDIPIIVVSSGMKPVIRALLENLVGEHSVDKIEIVSNDARVEKDQSWRIVHRDETPFGHDKSRAIRPYSDARPQESTQKLFYCGDGVSDLSAAKETDLLFAKRGKDLVTICKRDKIPFTQFDSFADILTDIKAILAGETSIEDLDENRK